MFPPVSTPLIWLGKSQIGWLKVHCPCLLFPLCWLPSWSVKRGQISTNKIRTPPGSNTQPRLVTIFGIRAAPDSHSVSPLKSPTSSRLFLHLIKSIHYGISTDCCTIPHSSTTLYGRINWVHSARETKHQKNPDWSLFLRLGPPQEEFQEGFGLLPHGLWCFWYRYVDIPQTNNPSNIANSSPRHLGRTTFVNTLCGKHVLGHKDSDDPANAHIEEGVKIKPITVGMEITTVVCLGRLFGGPELMDRFRTRRGGNTYLFDDCRYPRLRWSDR